MDHPDISFINPGKNDHGKKTNVQKRYLLWPLMDVLGILNRADDNDGETFQLKFEGAYIQLVLQVHQISQTVHFQ